MASASNNVLVLCPPSQYKSHSNGYSTILEPTLWNEGSDTSMCKGLQPPEESNAKNILSCHVAVFAPFLTGSWSGGFQNENGRQNRYGEWRREAPCERVRSVNQSALQTSTGCIMQGQSSPSRAMQVMDRLKRRWVFVLQLLSAGWTTAKQTS